MTQLVERIRSASPVTSTPLRWRSLPRDIELRSVREALAAGRSLLVVGTAGVGKTHLVESAFAAVPNPALPDVPAVDGPVSVSAASVEPGAGLAGAHPVLHELLAGRGGRERPVVLRVEDGHLLGAPDALALGRLVRQGEIQLVMTLRSAGASRSPWLELWKDGLAERVDVRPFTAEQTRRLLEDVLDGPTTAETFHRLWELTRGNGFFLRELVRTAYEAGDLWQHHGVWVMSGPGEAGTRVRDLVEAETGRLDPVAREALQLVALAEPVPVTVLVELVPAGVLDRLVHDGLVTVGQRGRVLDATPSAHVTHPLFGEAVRGLVPLDRRRRLYTAVQDAHAATGVQESRPALVRSVLWALGCGIPEPTGRVVAAMHAATALHRWDAVVELGAAVGVVGAPGRTDADRVGVVDRAQALLLRAGAWRMLAAPDRAEEDLAAVDALLAVEDLGAAEDGRRDHLLLVEAAEQRADLDRFHGEDPGIGVARFDRVRERLSPVASGRDLLVLDVARLAVLGRAGRFTDCLEPSVDLLRAADAPDGDLLRLVAPAVLGLGQAGRMPEALVLGDRYGRSARSRTGQVAPWLASEIDVARFVVRLWSGDVEDAEGLLGPVVEERGPVTRDAVRDAFGHLGRGLLAAAHGRWSDARREHQTANALLSMLDPTGVAAFATASEALATAAVGEPAAARVLLQRAREIPLRSSAAMESDLRLRLLDAEAWLALPSQRAEAIRLARWCAERGLRRTELEALHRALLAGTGAGAARSGGPSTESVLARVHELAAQVSGRRARALVTHADAVVSRDPGLTLIATRDLAACGLWLPTQGSNAGLTRREREIAALAAGGLSSRAIAERLTLSVRTVDSHLSRVFTKLSVRGRQDLAAALADAG